MTSSPANVTVSAVRSGERMFLGYVVALETMAPRLTLSWDPVRLTERQAARVARLAWGDDTLTGIQTDVVDIQGAIVE